MRRFLQPCVFVLLLIAGAAAATAQPWPYLRPVRVASGFDLPDYVTNAGDGSGRVFIVEQRGRIRILNQATAFLDITARVLCCGERGLLSVAFPPNYAAKGYFYVDYIDSSGNTVVSRFFVTANPNVANSSSEQILLQVTQPAFPNHKGGQLAFGPDGYLYVALGDGGSAGDPGNRAQNPMELLGKILRIDVESGAATYAVPPSNPYVGNVNYRPEIWALGLRNPWRFSFDRATGDFWIADVGQGSWEEIDFQPAASPGGENYGWRVMEGAHCYNAATCNMTGFTFPIAEYDHSLGCSVTGGFVHRNPAEAALDGVYFYADYCSGRVWGLRRVAATWQVRMLLDSPFSVTTFGEDEAGQIYVADYNAGVLYRLRSGAAPADFGGAGSSDAVLYRNGAWFFFPSP